MSRGFFEALLSFYQDVSNIFSQENVLFALDFDDCNVI